MSITAAEIKRDNDDAQYLRLNAGEMVSDVMAMTGDARVKAAQALLERMIRAGVSSSNASFRQLSSWVATSFHLAASVAEANMKSSRIY